MTTTVAFIDNHLPGLRAGDYRLTASQTVTGGNKITLDNTFTGERFFTVQGARFSLDPAAIYAIFPPQGSLGEYADVLPHIAFTRTTLPWERSGHRDEEGYPWLALLVFSDGEQPEPTKAAVADLEAPSTAGFHFPGLDLETGQKPQDAVTVIDVRKSALAPLLPALEDLKLSAHVRQGSGGDNDLEVAVLLATRLPKPGSAATVHLVSLEGRYHAAGFDFQGADDHDLIRLVTLKNWSFTAVADGKSFKGLLQGLDRSPSTLRLPTSDNALAEAGLSRGAIPVEHDLRQGGKTFSWFHGPLVPGHFGQYTLAERGILLPARGPDELLCYQKARGLFDASYAAAWQVGRLLALADKNFSVPLYNWKRACARTIRDQDNGEDYSHLFATWAKRTAQEPILPAALWQWLYKLALLQGVPFNYLVADEHLLPQESMRFFHVDPGWVACLLDGAFSIGRALPSDLDIDRDALAAAIPRPAETVTGFLLRSQVVAGWPGLVVAGYGAILVGDDATAAEPLAILRMERLSDSVLIVLFEGEVGTVDISQKPESLHFGCSSPTTSGDVYYKELRNEDGSESDLRIDLPFRDPGQRTVSLKGLADSMARCFGWSDCPPSRFALQMTEGVEGVRFRREENRQ